MARSFTRTVLVAAAIVTAATLTLGAQARPLPAQQPWPWIEATWVSADQSTLMIRGANFGKNPMVTLNGVVLGGVQVDPNGQQLIAVMPSLVAGSYALVVANGNLATQFEITIGVNGPQGPVGATGPIGP
ncbi:MAG TPA: hypothetical protein VIW45_14835, partial [Vicinamibacterales bacterium]